MNNLIAYVTEGVPTGTYESSGVGAAILAFLGTFIFFVVIFIIASLVLWIWSLVDILNRPESDFKKLGNGDKNLWLVLVIASIFFGFHFIMSIVYYFVIYRPAKIKPQPVQKK